MKHLECFNDGIKLALHADAVKDGTGTLVANPLVTLRLLDKDGNILYEFQGSFDPAALDDYGQSLYLPDVVSNQTDAVVVTVGVGASIPPDSDAYGRDASNLNKWATSAVLAYFSEGGTGYATADYASAISRLKRTEYDYGYIASGGSQSIALLSQLAQLAFDTNRPFKYDVPGTLTPDAAAAWIAQLNLDSHYCHAFWAPLKSDDPLGLNGKSVIGTSTFNIARACARNAQTNAKGFAPKNFPIAGKEWPLDRTGIIQIYTPDETGQELSDLATAKINPVLFQVYNGGGRYVFTDSLTNAKTAVSMKKLISVAEMSATMDDWITRFGKEAIQLPIEVTIKKMNDFLKKLFEDAQSSGWIIPSVDLAGAAAKYLVQRSEIKPADNVVVTYSLRYDGTTRQITVTQTLSR
ncbi:hypothetical protein RR42_m1444 [Cupriavidus basilensis]|uniref:Uncharacterized protein n=1 Tax=Cupriavidus basilensis TaxID=68895 RepID=A0A0C4Y737_9BURK|nr:hypothetical protein RR42_m1444 [Cupriavidus basilensis]